MGRLPFIFFGFVFVALVGNMVGQDPDLSRLPDAPQPGAIRYQPISDMQRLGWFVDSTVGPPSLLGGVFSAGFGTAINSPREYGPHWEGFGKRYGMRLTGISVGRAIEAAGGAVTGEDPRYFRTYHAPLSGRAKNILDLTFRAYGSDRKRHLAFVRLGANVGNNFLSNTWRARSENDWQHASLRCVEGIGGRAASNAFAEFLPELGNLLRKIPLPF